MTLRRTLWTVLVLALLGAAGWGVWWVLQRPPEIEVGEVLREDVTRVLAVTGRVRPRQVVQVRPLAPGRLTALPLAEGDQVAEGDLLAQVDDSRAEAAVAQTEATLSSRRQQLEQDRRELGRAVRLHAEGLISEEDLERARLAVEQGVEDVRRLEKAVAEARASLDDYLLRASFAGRVLRRPVDPGQIVGTTTVLYEIASLENPWIEAQVDEIYLPEIDPGMAATLAPPGRRDRRWPARVVLLGDRVDPETGSVKVRLVFEGDQLPILPSGLSLDVNLTVDRHPDALTVPRAAVLDLDASPTVLRLEVGSDGATVPRRRPVEVIDWPAPRVVVLEGLAEGDRVVLDPARVPPDLPVRPRLAPDPGLYPGEGDGGDGLPGG